MKIAVLAAATTVVVGMSMNGVQAGFWDFFGSKKEAWSFSPLNYPVNDADFRRIRSSAIVANGKGERDVLRANALVRAGQQLVSGSGIFGAGININGQPIFTNSNGTTRFVGDSPDFSSVHPGPPENQYWVISHIEAPSPGQVYRTLIEQNPLTGSLTALDTFPVDFSALKGVWTPCSGSKTPWKTHLGSEEYEPDARAFLAADDSNVDPYVKEYSRYFGLYDGNATKANIAAVFNPYDYGFAWELDVAPSGATSVAKRRAMGRLAFEEYKCLADRKTCYGGDDGDNTMLAKFVADKAGDLSKGTLYGGKFTQKEVGGKIEWSLNWIKLGSASDKEIQAYIDSKIKFTDMFETAKFEKGCPSGFLSSNGGTPGIECLKVKPGMEKAAAFLETRRYAGMLRVTTEFNKMEGVTFNKEDNKLYVAITSIRRGMEDNGDKGKASDKYDRGTDNDIKLPYNPCGCVFEFDLDDKYNARTARQLVCGKPASYPAGSVEANARGAFSNTCEISKIANPDNIHYVEKAGTLLIYEDSESHTSNNMWAYTIKTGKLTRIASAVFDAEFSGANYEEDIGGFGYILYTVQHPYDSFKEEKASGKGDSAAYVGYIGPFKNTKTGDFWKQL